MKKYHIEFDIRIPEGISFEEVKEWVRYELHDNSSMSCSNPLDDEELEPIFGTLELEEV
jgi:hypothetical protein